MGKPLAENDEWEILPPPPARVYSYVKNTGPYIMP